MDNDEDQAHSRGNVLGLMDIFIERMLKMRRILLGVSMSGIILAPFAIGLSIFLFTHPRFFNILEREYEFGTVLVILLSVIISISIVWLVSGIKQYLTIRSWNDHYKEYLKRMDDINRKIATDYGLDQN